MTAPAAIRGGKPIASLEDLSAPEALLVRYLRDWCNGSAGKGRVVADAAAALGADEADRSLHSWAELLDLLAHHGRRALMLHHPECRCVGSDEAVFAHFVMTAAQGDREDAMLIASLLVRADLLCPAVHFAQVAGLAAARIALRGERMAAAERHSSTRH